MNDQLADSPPDGSEPEKVPSSGRMNWNWLLVVGGALMALGSFLPWDQASAFLIQISRNGMQLGANRGFSVDGLATLLFGIGAAGAGWARLNAGVTPRIARWSPPWLGLAGIVISGWDLHEISNFDNTIKSAAVSASIGYGLWLVLVGSVAVLLGGIRGPKSRGVEEAPEPSPIQQAVSLVAVLAIIGFSAAVLAGTAGSSTVATGTTPATVAPSATTTTTTTLAPGKPGTAFSITDQSGDNVGVEVYKVIDPATPDNQFDAAPSGQRLVAVQIGVRDEASGPFTDDMDSDTTLVGSDSQTYTAAFSGISGCTNFDNGTVDLTKGSTAVGCVVFELPTGVTPAQVDFKPEADFGGSPVQWNI